MKSLLILLVGLQIADGLVTRMAVTSGLVQEWNALVAPIAGEWSFLLLKVAGALASALALWALHPRFPGVSLSGAGCVVVFYGSVLAWNLTTLVWA